MSSSNYIAVTPGLTGQRSAQLATLVVFVAFLDFFAGLPLMSTYATRLGASEATAGFIVGVYSITNLPGNVVAGYILDRFGRRLPIALGLVATALSLAGYAVAFNAESLLIVRAVHGIAAAVLTPGAFAMLGDSTETATRGRIMGRSAASVAVAAIIGPGAAGYIGEIVSYEAVFLLTAVIMVITAAVFILGSRSVPDLNKEAEERGEEVATSSITDQEPFRLSWLVVACLAAFSWTIGVGTFTTYVPLNVEELGEPTRFAGVAFSLFAITALIMMAGVVGISGDRYGRLHVISVGLVLFTAGMFVMAWMPEVVMILTGMSIIGLGFGLLLPTATALVADSSGPIRRGLAFGIFYAAYSLGVTIGANVSGRIADAADSVTGVPYLVAGVVSAICLVFVLAALSRGIAMVRREAGTA